MNIFRPLKCQILNSQIEKTIVSKYNNCIPNFLRSNIVFTKLSIFQIWNSLISIVLSIWWFNRQFSKPNHKFHEKYFNIK